MKVLHSGSLNVKSGGPALSTYLTLKGLGQAGVTAEIIMPPLNEGGKLIADTSPEYLAYFDSEMPGFPEIGEIIVTDFMVKNMNPVMFSIKFMLEYNQPVNDRVEVILGAYTRFNVYSPKYITMPDSLLSLMNSALEKEGKPAFDPTTPLKSYYINSLDFGLTLGLAFKG